MRLYSASPPQTPPSIRSVPLRRSSGRGGAGTWGVVVMARAWRRPDAANTGERPDRCLVPAVGVPLFRLGAATEPAWDRVVAQHGG